MILSNYKSFIQIKHLQTNDYAAAAVSNSDPRNACRVLSANPVYFGRVLGSWLLVTWSSRFWRQTRKKAVDLCHWLMVEAIQIL